MTRPTLCSLLAATALTQLPAWASPDATGAVASAQAPRPDARGAGVGKPGAIEPQAHPAGARAYYDCAPWDGPALTVELPCENGAKLRLTVWGAGMTKLEAGDGTLTLGGDIDGRGFGRATLVFAEGEAARHAPPGQPSYVHLEARVVLAIAKGGAGNTLSGRVTFQAPGRPQQTVPLSLKIQPRVSPCG
jgi:hypothetical protein